jgi:sugar phosphate isomerase/epimerase
MINRDNLFLRIPFEKYKPEIAIQNHIGIEAAFTDSEKFYHNPNFLPEFKKLISHGPIPQVAHLPFIGLDLGSNDTWIRKLALDIVKEGLKIAIDCGIKRVVQHVSIIPQHTEYTRNSSLRFFEESLSEFMPLIEKHNMEVLLENTWEKEPHIFKKLLDEIHSKHVWMCLDIGHVHCFSDASFEEWWEMLKPKVRHIHLSDNRFDEDIHLIPGKGMIDYPSILPVLETKKDLTYTLEINPQEIRKALEYLESIQFI